MFGIQTKFTKLQIQGATARRRSSKKAIMIRGMKAMRKKRKNDRYVHCNAFALKPTSKIKAVTMQNTS